MNSKVLSGLFILALFVTGCISEFNAELPSSDVQFLIVDGNIMENTYATIYLSKSFPLNSPSIPEESLNINANIIITGSNGYSSPPAYYLGRGAYMLYVGQLDNDVEYGLLIEYDGDIYQSKPAKPLHTPEIDSISWVQPNSSGTVFFRVSTHDDAEGAKFFLWDYTEDWEIMSVYGTSIFFNPVEKEFFIDDSNPLLYCWKNSSSNKLFIGSTESLSENRIINKQLYEINPGSDRFSVLYSVTVNQKAISKEAFEYYQNKIVLNEEMGGIFTPQPFELKGNITCITDPSKKVIGYIEAVKNTTQKRIFILPSQIKHKWYLEDCELTTQEDVDIFLRRMELTYSDYYLMGFRPAGDQDMSAYPKILPLYWTQNHCTECTSREGTKRKPYFWPNDHK